MGRPFAIGARGHVLSVPGVFVSANYFDVLGTPIQAGRNFLDSEDRPAHGAVVVLGSALSRRLFGVEKPVGALMNRSPRPREHCGNISQWTRERRLRVVLNPQRASLAMVE